MSLLSFRSGRHNTQKQPSSARLSVEMLEDRRVLTTITVGMPNSGAAFSNLQAAIAAATSGDTIVVSTTGTTLGSTAAATSFGATATGSPGAMTAGVSNSVTLAAAPTANPKPGDVVTFTTNPLEKLVVLSYNPSTLTITFTTTARFTHNSGDTITATGDEGIWKPVTIMGDPSASRESIDTGTNSLIIAGGISKVTLSHVSIQNSATTTTAENLVIDEGSTGDVITDVTAGTITDNPYINGPTYPAFASTRSGMNTISFSTITNGVVVHGNTTGTATNDIIMQDTITGSVQLLNADGTTVSANMISGGVDIEGGAATTISVTGNTISGTTSNVTTNGNGTVTAGVVVVQPTPTASPVAKVNVNINGNTITNGATAIALSLDTFNATAGQNFTATISGNDLRNNNIGVAILGDSQGQSTSAGNITITGNNFKSFTQGSSSSYAITLNGTGAVSTPPATVNAKGNFFASSVTNENLIVQDAANGSGTGVITVDSTPATSAQGAINALYLDILGRAADPSGLAYWSSQPQSIAALGILNSPEAETRLVNDFYAQILGRVGDASGVAYYVNLLSTGATDETVMTDLLSSPEFYNRAQGLNQGGVSTTTTDQRYVAALYEFLLGRSASPSDLTFWTNLLSSNSSTGRTMVAAGFVDSAEFRQRVVTEFYGDTTFSSLMQLGFPDLLHRTTAPSTAEVSFWVNSGLDLKKIEAFFLSSAEFAANG